ncbi:hypothetical protein, partial [Georgenia sp. Marseille-Q6866]
PVNAAPRAGQDGTVPTMGDQQLPVMAREPEEGVVRRVVVRCCLAAAAVYVASWTLGALKAALALLG